MTQSAMSASVPAAASRDSRVVLPTRHPGRWTVAALILVLGVGAAVQVVQNPRFEWGVVGDYLFAKPILTGVLRTLMLTGASMAIGIFLGIVFAIMRLSPNPILRSASWLYSWFFRGTPLLVQLLFWYFLSALYPTIGAGSISWSTNSLISALTAALLGLGRPSRELLGELRGS